MIKHWVIFISIFVLPDYVAANALPNPDQIFCRTLISTIGLTDFKNESDNHEPMFKIVDPKKDKIVALFQKWLSIIESETESIEPKATGVMGQPVTNTDIQSCFNGWPYQIILLPTFLLAGIYARAHPKPTLFDFVVAGGAMIVGAGSFLYGTWINTRGFNDLLVTTFKKTKRDAENNLDKFKSNTAAIVRDLILHITGSPPATTKHLIVKTPNGSDLLLQVGYSNGLYFFIVDRNEKVK